MGKKKFIFDLDDTLIWLEQNYSRSAIAFMEYLLEIWGGRVPFAGEVFTYVQKVSFRLIKEANPRTGRPYGFSIDRFPDTLVEVYRTMCENGWGRFNRIQADRVRGIGQAVFSIKRIRANGMVPGAAQVLDFLDNKNNELALLTKGDPLAQKPKIEALNLKNWFSEVTIVDTKTSETLRQAMGNADPASTYSVGNSFSSDIRPALDAGMKAIFIPCATWQAESIDPGTLTPDEQSRLITVRRIDGIIDIYDTL